MPKIKIGLSHSSVQSAIQELKAYQKTVAEAGDKIAASLAALGYSVAFQVMSNHIFSGETIGNLEIEKVSDGKYILKCESEAILFFEFGAGARYGGGHPWDDFTGMGPGSYPGNGHWNDPNGWWFPTNDPRLKIYESKDGQGWGHSYGNQPYMPFYRAYTEMKRDLEEIARRVLNG